VINGYHSEHNSQMLLHRVYVSQAEECLLSVTVSFWITAAFPLSGIKPLHIR